MPVRRIAVESPEDDRCADVPFVACGGDLEGEWVLSKACGTTEQIGGSYSEGPDPYASCAEDEHLVDSPMTISGSIEFAADGEWWKQFSLEVLKHSMVSNDCLDSIGETCHEDCNVESGICDCLWQDSNSNGGNGGYWVYGADGTVTLDETAASYCVDGDSLAIELPHYTGPYWMIYERAGGG